MEAVEFLGEGQAGGAGYISGIDRHGHTIVLLLGEAGLLIGQCWGARRISRPGPDLRQRARRAPCLEEKLTVLSLH